MTDHPPTDPISRLNTALAGRYRIERELDSGGMARVYVAFDLRNRRKVALKVLKPEVAASIGAERFLGEISTTANLQHPHILPLFDSGEIGGFVFYVMPLVEGESLRRRLERERQLPVGEAVRIAVSVARALDYAHRHGVIHRDVKPANILFHDGEPMIGDFGIALATHEGAGERLTDTGLAVGTPHYMSPEQVSGDQPLTPRSDIHGLACVLYEMLAGVPPYQGANRQAVVTRILRGEAPALREVRRSVPVHVESAVQKALESLPADRFVDAGRFAAALEDPEFRHGSARASGASAAARGWQVATAAVSVLFLGLLAWSLDRRGARPSIPTTRQAIDLSRLGPEVAWGTLLAISPDGQALVYRDSLDGGGVGLFYKRPGELRGTFLPGTEGGSHPTFSPDGASIAYLARGDLLTRRVDGGVPTVLWEGNAGGGPTSIDWLSDGTILFEIGDPDQILRIPAADGSSVDTVTVVRSLRWIHGVEEGNGVIFLDCAFSDCLLQGMRFGAPQARSILDGVARAWYVDRLGMLIWVRRDGVVLGAPFDAESMRITGSESFLFDGVRTERGVADMIVGDDGTVVYVRGSREGPRPMELAWVGPDGTLEESVPGSRSPDLEIRSLILSPDRSRVALELVNPGSIPTVWIMPLPDGPLSPLAPADYATFHPKWAPDGQEILAAFGTRGYPRSRIGRFRADGSSGEPEIVLDLEDGVAHPEPLPDGRGFLFGSREVDDWVGVRNPDSGETEEVLRTGATYQDMEVSPDGRWFAYVSNESGSLGVWVRPLPDPTTARVQVSTDGAYGPVWSDDGRHVYYVGVHEGGEGVFRVRFRPDPEQPRMGERAFLFPLARGPDGGPRRRFDLDEGGERFLVARTVEDDEPSVEDAPPTVVMIRNWFSEVESLTLGAN